MSVVLQSEISSTSLFSSVLYQRALSDELLSQILQFYDSVEAKAHCGRSSQLFPMRKFINYLPDHLLPILSKEVMTYFTTSKQSIKPSVEHIRIYHSNYGIVQPHFDVPINVLFNYTCIIYLTDDFMGGHLSIEIPTVHQINEEGEGIKEEEGIIVVDGKKTKTILPQKGYGVIFPKPFIHYTDELFQGDKVILIVDCQVELR